MLLIDRSLAPRPVAPEIVPTPAPRGPAVFLPPAEVLRKLQTTRPVPAPPAVRPTPIPTPPPGRDRISVGGPSADRAKGPMLLRREDDLTATPRGTARGDGSERAQATPPPTPVPSPPSLVADGGGAGGRLRLPPGIGRAEPPPVAAPGGPPGPSSLSRTLRDLDRRLAEAGPRGTVTGTGQQMGPLFFDPEGADFTVWINHFKNEVYRNWLIPQAVLLGIRGHVDLEFTVERDGSVTGLKLVKSIGNPALDKAAANAIIASRFTALPSDFAPPRVTMQVSFFYGEGPQG
ncbi:MAG TPA: energy transducer TonB [Vicinamibacteria bacterium]